MSLRADATADCAECHLPMFPVDDMDDVTLECANRHRATVPPPADPALRRLVQSWVARRGAQLHTQHERWADEAEQEGEEETDG